MQLGVHGEAGAFASLRVANFRRYFVGQTLSSVGTWFHILALALLVVEETGSGGALGVVVGLQTLPLLVFGSYAGVLLDRHDPRRAWSRPTPSTRRWRRPWWW